MEMGSSVYGSPPNSSESLNGLKFGQKIYFEDVGIGVPAKSGCGSSSSSGSGDLPPADVTTKKARGGAGFSQGGQPPRCQVEGCKLDLSDAKAYYSRHKVCGVHSKTPTVIVGGLEQRFCQQCSRFHQLPEFDQGKRSCRRRLAGHNQRRRKPLPGSLLSTCYGRLSSSVFDSSSRGGGFLMDFTSQPKLLGRDIWPAGAWKSTEQLPGNQATFTGKFISQEWQSNSGHPSSAHFQQGSSGGTGFSSPGVSLGECFTGVSDSSCALSLLSNQSWVSRNRSSDIGVANLMSTEAAPMGQPTQPHFPVTSWGFKASEATSSSHGMRPDLGLGQFSPTINSQFSGNGLLEPAQQNERQYMALEHSRAYDSSTQQMNWSL